MTDWFRSWHGAPTDPKWLVIGRRAGVPFHIVSAVVWALFDHASQQEDRGCIRDFDVETYAALAELSEEQVHAVISALRDKGIIADYRLTAWEKRQPKKDDGAAERSKAWRERNRTQPNAEERPEKSREDTEKKDTSSLRSDAAPCAPMDPRTLLFSQGLPLLAKITGRPQDKLRGLLGKWLQAADDEPIRVLSLISQADRDRIVDPVSWIAERLKPKIPLRAIKGGNAMDAWDKVIDDERSLELAG